MKWILIGKKGMLGSVFALGEVTLPGELAACLDIDEIDITKKQQVDDTIAELKPDMVINCSAFTNVDGAESEHEACRAVNVEGVKHLASACNKRNALLVHYSTDFIFDGRKHGSYGEDDDPSPLNYYGYSKIEGEKKIRSILGKNNFLIIRTSWLFGPRGKNFVSTILSLAKEKPELKIVDDQKGCPTYTRDLARATRTLLEKSARGVFHVTNSGSCNWYDFARYALDCAGFTSYPTKRISSDDLNRPARRPANSMLDTKKFETVTQSKLRPWQDAVKEYVGEFLT